MISLNAKTTTNTGVTAANCVIQLRQYLTSHNINERQPADNII